MCVCVQYACAFACLLFCVFVFICMFVFICVCAHSGDVRYQWLGARARVVAVRCHRPGSRASAAGVTWTRRTTSAEWAGRSGHTTVVDAAGAIYVIGGFIDFHDAWASTDGGAPPASFRGYSQGY